MKTSNEGQFKPVSKKQKELRTKQNSKKIMIRLIRFNSLNESQLIKMTGVCKAHLMEALQNLKHLGKVKVFKEIKTEAVFTIIRIKDRV